VSNRGQPQPTASTSTFRKSLGKSDLRDFTAILLWIVGVRRGIWSVDLVLGLDDSCQTLIISVVYTDDLFGCLMPDFNYFRSLQGRFVWMTQARL
jgi:hypothetical protein